MEDLWNGKTLLLIETDLYFDAKNSAMTYNNFSRNAEKKEIIFYPLKKFLPYIPESDDSLTCSDSGSGRSELVYKYLSS